MFSYEYEQKNEFLSLKKKKKKNVNENCLKGSYNSQTWEKETNSCFAIKNITYSWLI